MNDRIVFRSDSLTEAASELNSLKDALEHISSELASVDTSAEWWSKLNIHTSQGRKDGAGMVYMLRKNTDKVADYVSDVRKGVIKTQRMFQDVDTKVNNAAKAMAEGRYYEYGDGTGAGSSSSSGSPFKDVIDTSKKDHTLPGAMDDYSGIIAGLKGAKNLLKYGGKFADAYNSFKNYMKIGPAIGTKKAITAWAAKTIGVKMGRASTAKKVSTRFINNMKNKTSSFNMKQSLKDAFGKYTGAKGAGKAALAWAGVALEGAVNWFSNKEEQQKSNGSMSNGRVVAETITETAVSTVVGTVVATGAKVVVGAAVTAVAGTVGSPVVLAVATVALATAATTAIDAGFKAVTGKKMTEWVSDTILDTGAAIGKGISTGAKKIGKAFAGWSKKFAWD